MLSQSELSILPAKINNEIKAGRLNIQKAISELQLFRNEVIPEETIVAWILEFENLGIKCSDAVFRIKSAKYKKQYGNTKFSDFINEDDSLIPMDIVFKKARDIFYRDNEKTDRLSEILFKEKYCRLTMEQRSKMFDIINDYENIMANIAELADAVETYQRLLDKVGEKRKQYESFKESFKEQVVKETSDAAKKAIEESSHVSDYYKLLFTGIMVNYFESLKKFL